MMMITTILNLKRKPNSQLIRINSQIKPKKMIKVIIRKEKSLMAIIKTKLIKRKFNKLLMRNLES